jgi:3-oxoacyl-[acyl-carrier-protein] synthase II
MKDENRIVVTGMGLVSCFGDDVDTFYDNLLMGNSGVITVDEFVEDEFPTTIAGIIRDFDVKEYMHKKQARRVDPFISYAMVAGKKAMQSANLSQDVLDTLDRSKVGAIIGSGMGGMSVFYNGAKTLITKGYKRITPFFVPYIITNMAGALLAIDENITGPNFSISTACATSNYCIHAAASQVRSGVSEIMLCGGSEAPMAPIGLAGFIAARALSTRNDEPKKASRPWDKNRDGFVMGEGSGVIILETLKSAKKRNAPIYAEYLGGSINCDAYHMTVPKEDGKTVQKCMEDAILDAGISREKINYINGHATSTIQGDLAELIAVNNTFKDHSKNISINATKSMTGHCLGAAGGIEAIATIKAIMTKKIHPTINLDDPVEELQNLDPVKDKYIEKEITAAMSNSFGFGGHNSSIIFGPFKE